MTDNILARLRIAKQMTQAQLAAASGVHVQALSKLERGERPLSNLRLSTALALADALEADPHLFLDE
jgi:transcriptional regulator with XRE-family HTH domain